MPLLGDASAVQWSAAGVNPKIETRKLGTIFIEWEETQIVRKEPCLYQGVQGGRGAADTRWRERERLAPGGPDQTQRAVPLARCVPQGWGSGIAAAGGPAAGSPESAAAGCQSGGGRCAAGSGVGAQNWSTSSGYRFFAKSLQACKGIASEEHSGGNPGETRGRTGRCRAVASISLGKRPCGKRPTCFGRVVARSERMDRARKVRLSSITLARSPDHFTPCFRLASERDARC